MLYSYTCEKVGKHTVIGPMGESFKLLRSMTRKVSFGGCWVPVTCLIGTSEIWKERVSIPYAPIPSASGFWSWFWGPYTPSNRVFGALGRIQNGFSKIRRVFWSGLIFSGSSSTIVPVPSGLTCWHFGILPLEMWSFWQAAPRSPRRDDSDSEVPLEDGSRVWCKTNGRNFVERFVSNSLAGRCAVWWVNVFLSWYIMTILFGKGDNMVWSGVDSFCFIICLSVCAV